MVSLKSSVTALRRSPGLVTVASMVKRRQRAWFPYLLIAPTVAAMVALLGYPLVRVIWLSLTDYDMFEPGTFVGIQNYIDVLLHDTLFWTVIRHTIVWTSASVALEFVIAFFIALLLNQVMHGRAFFRAMILLPWIVPPVTAALIWEAIYDPGNGILNHVLSALDLGEPLWLADSDTALWSVIAVAVWKYNALILVGFLAGLQSIPQELYEAAAVDGASPSQTLRFITIPALMPIASVLALLAVVWRAAHFDLINLLTGGGPASSTQLVSTYAYQKAIVRFEVGIGSAIAILGALGVLLFAGYIIRRLVTMDLK